MRDTGNLLITNAGETAQVAVSEGGICTLQTAVFTDSTAQTGSEPTMLHINHLELNRQEALTLILKLAGAFGVAVTFAPPFGRKTT